MQRQSIIILLGPILPFTISYHSVMQTDENHVLIIGGRQDSYTSEETWQYNIDDWSLSEGPPLNVAREGHCCGKILINDRDPTKTRTYPEPRTFQERTSTTFCTKTRTYFFHSAHKKSTFWF